MQVRESRQRHSHLYQHPEKREAMAKASLERSKLFDNETYAKNFFAAIDNLFIEKEF